MQARYRKQFAQGLRKAHFYGILDTTYVAPRQWVEKCRALLEGGANLVQLRAKQESAAERVTLLDAILPLFANRQVPLIINDHIELALSRPNLGLHIGQDDMSPEIARQQLGPDRILGLSTHSLDQAIAALALKDILSYFAVGPLFPTPTKPNKQAIGLAMVRQVKALNPALPFFAIGGIKRENISIIKATGIDRIVAVSDVLCAQDTAAAVRNIRYHLLH